jgi:glucose-6-phosphate dehydrogenase assembly protein OpcA
MSTNNAVPLGERMQIDIRSIERELTAMWKQIPSDSNEDFQSVTRTCVLTLLAIVNNAHEVERATNTIADLTSRHPNRAIVINTDTNHDPELLDAWVQAHCQIPNPGRPQVCCEQITIAAGSQAQSLVPGTVLPLLVPDLPVILWWPNGDPFKSSLFLRLRELADRLVIDSATSEEPLQTLLQLHSLLADQQACNIGDMVWGRLTAWRELIAQFFDPPAMVPHLSQITRLWIAYAYIPEQGRDPSQALLLAGWLGSRLGWKLAGPLLEDGDEISIAFQRPDGVAVSVELTGRAYPHIANLVVEEVKIACENGHFALEQITDEMVTTMVELSGKQAYHHAVHMNTPQNTELLLEELRVIGNDQSFEAALHLISGLFD